MEPARLEAAEIARAAAAGDEAAWRALVARFDSMLHSIVRGYRLDPADADDVVQSTWIRAYDNLHRINEPAAIGGWLAVTARREALRTLQRGVREVVAEDPQPKHHAEAGTPETETLENERRAAVRAAVGRLPTRQRTLLSTFLRRPAASYDEISVALDMPIGSIGPTRERALSRLRDDLALTGVLAP
jgi:RNA polymerase sigma factor (sigma-70 family)